VHIKGYHPLGRSFFSRKAQVMIIDAVANGVDVLNAHFEPSLSEESRYSSI